MRKIILHAKRLFRILKYILIFLIIVAPIYYILWFFLIFIFLTLFSVLFFSDPIDEKKVLKHFSENDLLIIASDSIDENVSDSEYLSLMVKYVNVICPRRIDRHTTWTGARVTSNAFTSLYESKKKSEDIDFDKYKKKIIRALDKDEVKIQRIIRSNRDLVFSYTCPDLPRSVEVVISNDELKAL